MKPSDQAKAEALDGWSDGLPPCTACGVCCFFEDPRYVMVFESDEARLGPHLETMTHWISGRRFMRQVDGHCIALRQQGEFWLCSIHEHRPQLCRDFARGCDTCRELVPLRHPRFKRSHA